MSLLATYQYHYTVKNGFRPSDETHRANREIQFRKAGQQVETTFHKIKKDGQVEQKPFTSLLEGSVGIEPFTSEQKIHRLMDNFTLREVIPGYPVANNFLMLGFADKNDILKTLDRRTVTIKVAKYDDKPEVIFGMMISTKNT